MIARKEYRNFHSPEDYEDHTMSASTPAGLTDEQFATGLLAALRNGVAAGNKDRADVAGEMLREARYYRALGFDSFAALLAANGIRETGDASEPDIQFPVSTGRFE